MNFFDPSHKIPNIKDQFLKLKAGANKFRFIGQTVTGFEFFIATEDGKALKLTRPESNPFTSEELLLFPAHPKSSKKPKYFMACCVYEWESDSFKIISLTQAGILDSIKECLNNPDYGSQAETYDFTITKKGEGMETEYSTMPSPPKPLPKAIAERAKTLQYDLNKLFDNEYPADSFPFEGKAGAVKE